MRPPLWWTFPLDECMEQINAYAFYLLGKWMDSIYLHAKMPLKANIAAWQWARTLLEILIEGQAKVRLKESAESAQALLQRIDSILALHQQNADVILTDEQVNEFNGSWGKFENDLQLDLTRAPIFFVKRKGIYETPPLINSAEYALVDDVRREVSPEAKRDLNQAGRCLAFELATASGYHALRAVEKVSRDYLSAVTGKPLEKANLKGVIDGLRGSGKADVKTMAVLDQIRDLHRNPIDHPELFLELPEAMELFDICKSAISVMARQMMKLKATP